MRESSVSGTAPRAPARHRKIRIGGFLRAVFCRPRQGTSAPVNVSPGRATDAPMSRPSTLGSLPSQHDPRRRSTVAVSAFVGA